MQTHRPKSICLFSNRPSRGREETSAYHGSNGYLERGGVLKQAAFSTMHFAKTRPTNDAANAMQCKPPEQRISAKMR